MRNFLLLLLLIGFSSCFLFKDYKRKPFAYTQAGQSQTLSLLVPKGYTKETVSDTAGIQLHSFQYADGSLLYAAYLADTTFELQSFDKAMHQPKPFGKSGVMYKGQNNKGEFYREIRQGALRFGYWGVGLDNETLFDSATNYAAMRRP